MKEVTRMLFDEIVELVINLQSGQLLHFEEVNGFDDEGWCLYCFYEPYSETNKYILTHKSKPEIYPSTILDMPTADTLATWKIWFQHILRIKGLLNLDKYGYVSIIDKQKETIDSTYCF